MVIKLLTLLVNSNCTNHYYYYGEPVRKQGDMQSLGVVGYNCNCSQKYTFVGII